MIYDFALEPDLVATWHDPRVAFPFTSQMGLGHCRVPCLFPAAGWKNLVMDSLRSSLPAGDDVAWQSARKKVDILIGHLAQTTTRRGGTVSGGAQWLPAALAEHEAYRFGGMLVRSCAQPHAAVVAVDRVHEQPGAWSPASAPVPRTATGLAAALAPLLRSATQLRFVDPYFDPADSKCAGPMKAYLAEAQKRRTLGELSVQLHFAVTGAQIEQENRFRKVPVTQSGLAKERLDACVAVLAPALNQKVKVVACAWGVGGAGHAMHNRYLLTELGGVAVQHGLDEGAPGETDDMTLLSREQLARRWAEYTPGGSAFRSIGTCAFDGQAQLGPGAA